MKLSIWRVLVVLKGTQSAGAHAYHGGPLLGLFLPEGS